MHKITFFVLCYDILIDRKNKTQILLLLYKERLDSRFFFISFNLSEACIKTVIV